MSDALRLTDEHASRPLRKEERALLNALLDSCGLKALSCAQLDGVRVTDMLDGSMGSIRFVQHAPRRYGKTLAEARFLDEDGALVSVALNADEQGDPLEMDFWKVDFTPLRRYPSPSEIETHPLNKETSARVRLSHPA